MFIIAFDKNYNNQGAVAPGVIVSDDAEARCSNKGKAKDSLTIEIGLCEEIQETCKWVNIGGVQRLMCY
jgi:hypothetical protein